MPPLGYQVVDSEGNYPQGMWSFEIYTLEACSEKIKEDKKRWRLLPIWDGDIEEPTIVCPDDSRIILS